MSLKYLTKTINHSDFSNSNDIIILNIFQIRSLFGRLTTKLQIQKQ